MKQQTQTSCIQRGEKEPKDQTKNGESDCLWEGGKEGDGISKGITI